MKIYLAGLEAQEKIEGMPFAQYVVRKGMPLKWSLMSFYNLRNEASAELADWIAENGEGVLIDSGVFTLQRGLHEDIEEYTKQYAKFIEKHDNEHYNGFFEIDLDNVIGYSEVLRMRDILLSVTDKVIPVWHNTRGIHEYWKMCEEFSGKTVAITGFGNVEVKPKDYAMFLKVARVNGCKLHALGMTRKRVLDRVPFDSTDSISWRKQVVYGQMEGKKAAIPHNKSKTQRQLTTIENYKQWVKLQEYYYSRWENI